MSRIPYTNWEFILYKGIPNQIQFIHSRDHQISKLPDDRRGRDSNNAKQIFTDVVFQLTSHNRTISPFEV